MQVADRRRENTQLQWEAAYELRETVRTDLAPAVRYETATNSRNASAARVSRVIVEGELGTWHERDAVDPAIPDIAFGQQEH